MLLHYAERRQPLGRCWAEMQCLHNAAQCTHAMPGPKMHRGLTLENWKIFFQIFFSLNEHVWSTVTLSSELTHFCVYLAIIVCAIFEMIPAELCQFNGIIITIFWNVSSWGQKCCEWSRLSTRSIFIAKNHQFSSSKIHKIVSLPPGN